MKLCFQCGREFKESGKFCTDACATLYLRAIGQSHSVEGYCRQAGIELKKKGREFVALCPLHQEKSESFYVYPDHFYCYGCERHGDSVDLCSAIEGISLLQAAEKLSGGEPVPVIIAEPIVNTPPYKLSDKDLRRMCRASDRLAHDQKLIICKKRPEWTPEAIQSLALDGDLGYEDNCVFYPSRSCCFVPFPSWH